MSYNPVYAKKWRENNPNYHKEWIKANPHKKYNERAYRYAKNNRVKVRARNAVYYAVKVGKLIRPDTCSNCNKKGIIQADHHDYSLPLDVTWLCRPCHQVVTMKRKK